MKTRERSSTVPIVITTINEQPYGPVYRKYGILNQLSKQQIQAFAKDARAQGDIEFANSCDVVLRTDTTRFKPA